MIEIRKEIIRKHLEDIQKIAAQIDRPITIMEICGGHTNIIMKYGIRDILPSNIRLISGPGCPVCVSAQHDIDCMIALADAGIPVATYGDMMRVPGSHASLEDAKARHGNVFEIYSTTDVLKLKEQHPDIVFFGIGFETTAPMTAFLLKNDVCVYSVHKLVPPALKILSEGDMRIDGFLDPGHVSTVIGTKAYEDLQKPQAISGFGPELILRAIAQLLELIRDNKENVINSYPEAVRYQGNEKIQKLFDEVFYIIDSEWRGFGMLAQSGLEVRNDALNAKIKYRHIITKVPPPRKTACRCGEVLKGLIEPTSCPLYSKACTPKNPIGACMVSDEGSCAIYYRYGKSKE